MEGLNRKTCVLYVTKYLDVLQKHIWNDTIQNIWGDLEIEMVVSEID